MRGWLLKDWSMRKARRPARASNNAKDASANMKEEEPQLLLPIDPQAKISVPSRLWSLSA